MLYLDSAGLIASLANRYLLKQNIPTIKQIRTWDSFLVTLSKFLDPLLGYKLGKSLLAVFQKKVIVN